ncbi:hypothetical protein EM868_20845 [Cupriavidus gilardii]|uniref:helix-turn-helix domain-containing protein n=1 Tax=Cupriavidus gilardii TaxID=82541 RepID=UPI001EE5A072|nr:helix-turn-helix domain-containing protein [Cupriavidus gilardii]MCG5262774.1 helix-turn-helix domain containing protein [Cupriavidus gilardii]MDF9432212.1 hypothetical protein [Cupriavidus gilardii]
MMAVSGARKRIVPAFGDPANWPQPSIESFSESARATYRRRERAVRLYVAHVPFDVITRETGLSRREVYRLLDRFTVPHPVHGIYGLLALVPGQRIRGYRRQKPVRENAGTSSGYAGAFGALIERVPQAVEVIHEELLGTGASTEPMFDRAPTFRVLHRHWLAALRDLGLSDVDWPFCTGNRGYTTLVRYCKTLMQRYPDRAVRRRFGKAAAQRMASVGHGVPALIQPQRPGSFAILDFSRVDAASCLSLETPEGRVLHQVLPRWYIAMLVDELTTATWSAFATLEIEPSADSVLETLDRAIRPRAYVDASRTEQGQALAVHIQELVPELGFSGVTVLKLDNAKCNRAHEVVSNIIDTLGCAVNFGPPHQWQRRAVVEKTIGQVSADGIKRLASSYGTGPADPRRPDAAREAIRHKIDYRDVERLLFESCRTHNQNSTERLDFCSPVQRFNLALARPATGVFFNPLPAATLRDPVLLDHVEDCVVRGSLEKGVRPHVRPMRCRYTSPTLARSWELIGKVLRLRIKRYDVRQVTAIRPDTGEVLGPLHPEPRWRERPLSWRMRKLILRAGLQASAEERLDPMPAWNAAVQSRVLGVRRSRAKQRKASKDALLLAQHARLELTAQGGQPRPQASANGVQPTNEVVDEASSPHPADPFGLDVVPHYRLK